MSQYIRIELKRKQVKPKITWRKNAKRIQKKRKAPVRNQIRLENFVDIGVDNEILRNNLNMFVTEMFSNMYDI